MALDVRDDVPLSPLTTLGVGGAARHYVRARELGELEEALHWAAARRLPVFVLGGGSNVVFADGGFPGLVVHVALRGVAASSVSGEVELEAAAGEEWDALVASTVASGWAGLECLSGIPGFVGATPIQNVGAYGQEVSDTLVWVEAYDTEARALVRFRADECGFAYRQSRFKREDRGRYVIVRVAYRLVPDGAPTVRYPELQRALAAEDARAPTLAAVRDAVLRLRRRKSMVLDPGDPNARSVGSFFMNPILAAEAAEALVAAARARGDVTGDAPVPAFPAGEGRVKLSAAWLIERAGLHRGYRRGPAGISENHCLAIVNCGGSRASEILALAREVRAAVRERFGVTLEPEPVLVGASLD